MMPTNEMLEHQRRERLLKDFELIRAATTNHVEEWKFSDTEWINRVRIRLNALTDAPDDLESQYRAWMLVAAEAAGAAEVIMAKADGALNFIFDVPDLPITRKML